MKVTVSKRPSGAASAPPSKSMAHRMVIAAALANGKSRIENLEWSADVTATLNAAEAFGATVTKGADWAEIEGVEIPKEPKTAVDCGESGSTLRFLIPILAQSEKPVELVGHGRLPERPQQIYAKLFAERDLMFEQTATGVKLCGALQGGEYRLRGDVSSQFISGLLFALPLAKEDSVIHILPPFESRSYVDLTLQTLELFGISVQWQDAFTLFVKGNQTYTPHNTAVEGDWSNAAFLAVLGALTQTVQIKGLNQHTKQGDVVIFEILKRCGVKISTNNQKNVEFSTPNGLRATVIDLADCPDLGPVLMAFAMFCKGTTRIEHAGRLRIKESDRIAAMAAELKKFGAVVREIDSETLEIEGCIPRQPTQPICSHNDHRVVMACAVAALGAGISAEIEGAQAVQKSWPAFFEVMEQLGVEVRTDV